MLLVAVVDGWCNRNRAGDAAIQIRLIVQIENMGEQWECSRCTHRKHLVVHLFFGKKVTASGGQIGCTDMDLNLRGKKGIIVKRNVLFWNYIKNKFQIKGAVILEHIARADITFILAEAEVNLCIASRLFGSITDSVERSGRNTVNIGQIQALFHEIVENTGGIDAAEAAAFQYQTGIFQVWKIHTVHPFKKSKLLHR